MGTAWFNEDPDIRTEFKDLKIQRPSQKNKGSTYFLFLDKESKKPISGLSFLIFTSDNESIECITNEKGYFEISKDKKAPFKLCGYYHNKIKNSNNKLPDIEKDIYTFEKQEEKPETYIESLEDKSTNNSKKLLVDVSTIKIETGDTLQKLFKKHLSTLNSKSNKGSVLLDFNFGEAIKGQYRAFDLTQEGTILIPKFDSEIVDLKNKQTHIFYVSKIKRKPFVQKLLNDTNVIKRNIWTNQSLNSYDILAPSLINSKKTPLEFDLNYDTIVLHNTGNGLGTKVNALENKHIVENNWEDVGYHFIIGRAEHKESKIYEARPLIFKGAHASGDNSKKIGILVEGDFEHQWWDFDDEVEPNQIVLLKKLIRAIIRCFPIRALVGHSDVSGKEIGDGCPGEELYNYIPNLRKIFNLKG